MNKIVLIRHGKSLWNEENRFTGWADVELSEIGLTEARRAGEILKDNGYTFDLAFTSYLRRAIRTLWVVLDELDLMWIPVNKSWRLNERHYGALQGLSKDKTMEKYGEDQVYMWRRSVKTKPPKMDKSDSGYAGNEIKYSSLKESEIPLTENLIDTQERVLKYWFSDIAPNMKLGKKIIISAHGNTIRALVKYLDNVPDNGIIDLNIPTGVPLVYELDDNLKPITHYYLNHEGDIPKNKISANIKDNWYIKR
ncbi:MAG: 2,3-bisphosphoglycerate-dependent phosphoglycerate mutase [Clostridium sp.]|jgi:2,3-bisphosphoglycerate-dependent phosphoglycerate mutase